MLQRVGLAEDVGALEVPERRLQLTSHLAHSGGIELSLHAWTDAATELRSQVHQCLLECFAGMSAIVRSERLTQLNETAELHHA
jgi:hypothetical protein